MEGCGTHGSLWSAELMGDNGTGRQPAKLGLQDLSLQGSGWDAEGSLVCSH